MVAASGEQTSLLNGPGQPDHSATVDYGTTGQRVVNGINGHSQDREEGNTAPGATSDEVDKPTPRFTFMLPMAVGIFLCSMDQTIVVASYASIGSELNELQSTSWIATSYLLTITCIQPLYGKLSDIFGRKECLLFSYVIFAIGCLLCGLSRNMTELIASRAFAGIGGGGMQTIVSIIVSDVVPLRQRGTWQGMMNIVWTAGNSAGASLGGYMADTIGWRWAFLIQTPITVIAILSVSLALDLPPRERADLRTKMKRIDFAGALTLVVTVFCLLFALDRGGNVAWSDRITIASFVVSFIAFILFAHVELNVAVEPFAPKRIIANRSLIASYLVNLLGIASAFTVIFHIPLWFQAVQGKTATQASNWLLISIASALVGSLTGGLAIQATGKFYWITVWAYICLLGGVAVLTLETGLLGTSMVAVAFGLILSSYGNGTGITTSLVSLIANAGQEDQAIATAVSYLFRSLGSVVGLSIGSALVQGTLRSSLRRQLSGNDVEKIIQKVRESLDYLKQLDSATRKIVVGAYDEAIRNTMYFSLGCAVLALVAASFIKEKPIPRRRASQRGED